MSLFQNTTGGGGLSLDFGIIASLIKIPKVFANNEVLKIMGGKKIISHREISYLGIPRGRSGSARVIESCLMFMLLNAHSCLGF